MDAIAVPTTSLSAPVSRTWSRLGTPLSAPAPTRPIPPFPFSGSTLTRYGPTAAFGKVVFRDERGEPHKNIRGSTVHAYAGQYSTLRTAGSVAFGSTVARPTSAPAMSSTGLLSATRTNLDLTSPSSNNKSPTNERASRLPPIPRLDLSSSRIAIKEASNMLLSTSPREVEDALADTVSAKAAAAASTEMSFNELVYLTDPMRLAAVRSPARRAVNAEATSNSEPKRGARFTYTPRSSKSATTPVTSRKPRSHQRSRHEEDLAGFDWLSLPAGPAGFRLGSNAGL